MKKNFQIPPVILFLSCFPALFILHCAYDGTPVSVDLQPDYTGMIKIDAKGEFVTLGSSDTSSKDDEKPPMNVMFTYDFYLDTCEVTLGKYTDVTGKIPSGFDGIQYDSTQPVANISWFDAVLYCNALSKRNELDTLYSYTTCESTQDGKVYRLSDLKIDFNCNGYRLPTEAEWEFAARCGTNSTFPWGNENIPDEADRIGWYSGNSDNSTHAVAQKSPTIFGLYDLLGNVMEWVNDTKGRYEDTTKVNFVGLRSTTSDSRPVKGGSFWHSMEFLRPSARSDIYEITSSTALPYIGFRCAAGAIPQSSSNSEDTTLPRVPKLIVNSPLGFSLTNNVKLVFVNRKNSIRNLCYIDYSLSKPEIHTFNDMQNVYHPTISPDGKHVAFCTNGEGQETNSTIYIRRLDPNVSEPVALDESPAFIPRWWVDPTTNDTVIIFTDRTTINSLASWESSKTKKTVIKGGVPSGSPVVICENGSFHDGITTNGNYLATGYTLLKTRNNTTLETQVLFTGPDNGKQTGDTSQVCNVSVVQNSSEDEVLFLDFGYGSTSSIVGRPYKTHEILFLMDFLGNVKKWYEPPDDFLQWNYSECSNQPSIATAAVTDNDGTHPVIYALNLITDGRFRLVSGDDLLFPFLWVGDGANNEIFTLNTDSLGKYNEPPSHGYQRNLACKLPVFWKLAHSLETVFVGCSRMQNAVDSRHLSNKNCYNLSYGGCGIKGTSEMINNYVLLHCPKVRLIAMSFFVGKLNQKNGDLTWSTGTKNTLGYNYDLHHYFWRNGVPDIFQLLMDKAESLPEYPFLGFEPNSSCGWGSTSPTAVYEEWDTDDIEYKKNMNTIKTIAEDLKERNIHLLLIVFPMTPHFRGTIHYGVYGPGVETAHKAIDDVKILCSQSEYSHFYDAHIFGEHDFTHTDAYNRDHLSTTGAEKFTKRIDTLIVEILQ